MSKYGRLDEINQALADGQSAIEDIKGSFPSEPAIYNLKVQVAELQTSKGNNWTMIDGNNPFIYLRYNLITVTAIADEKFNLELKKQAGLRDKT